MPKFQCPSWKVNMMAAHVAQGSTAERPPPTPVERYIVRTKTSFRSRTEPQAPVQGRRNRRGPGRSLGCILSSDPDVNFLDFADRAGLDELDDTPVVASGVDL